MQKLDYTLDTVEERVAYLNKILKDETPTQQEHYYYTKYLFDIDTKTKSEKKIISDNRNATLTKREVSLEGICSKLENGENSIYNLVSHLGKAAYLTQKEEITEEEYATIPGLQSVRESIQNVEKGIKTAPPGKKCKLQKTLKELRQLQYHIKSEYQNLMYLQPNPKTIRNMITFIFDEHITITPDGDVISDSPISLFNPKHISAILCNYSKLKEDSWGNFYSDSWYILLDFDNLAGQALKEYPIYESIVMYKIDGKTNAEIQQLLQLHHGLTHSAEYISQLWRNRIPKIIAEHAKKEYLKWYYTFVEKGEWKQCTRCGEVKLAHSYWYSKNGTSKDGWYSLCKECKNKKNKKGSK